MNNLSYKIGYWSAIGLAFSFIIWIVSFVGIAIKGPLFFWTNPEDYITYYQSNSHFFQNLAYLFMLIAGPLYVLIINSYHDFVQEPKKVLVRVSMLFGLAFAVLSSMNYFVQLSVVRLKINSGDFTGIEHFTEANPHSVMTAVLMLGWTLFLGLSSFFIFPVFKGKRPEKTLSIVFLINGVSCVLAGIGYVLHIDVLTFIFANVINGAALFIISISSIKLFRRLRS